MTRIYDVAIVGGGPAGAATALYAARAGLEVALIEKRAFPRDKICGDAIARKAVTHLRELGVLDGVISRPHEAVSRAVLASPNGSEVEVDLSSPSEPAPHMVCRREIFDTALFEAARRECGATFESSPVIDVLRDGARVNGVAVRGNGRDEMIRARVVVGADGFDSVVARRLGLYRHDSSRWYVATRGYYRGLDVAPGTVEVRFFRDTLPGFLWVFPTGDGVANVGIGLVHRDIKRRHLRLRDVHEAVLRSPSLRERFARTERIGVVHGWNLPTPERKRVLAGDGFMFVGDAAGLVDPFSGEGIGNAFVSARVAAQTAAEALRAPNTAPVLATYTERVWAEVDAGEVALHYRMRSLARRARIIDFLVGRAAAHADVMQWMRSMTASNETVAIKRGLLSPLTYARLLMKK